jgi:hypothetical protein
MAILGHQHLSHCRSSSVQGDRDHRRGHARWHTDAPERGLRRLCTIPWSKTHASSQRAGDASCTGMSSLVPESAGATVAHRSGF